MSRGTRTICPQPRTSVLFDGRIPTLTGLDGDMWASQLLTLQTVPIITICFDFSGYERIEIERVEVVMFNCPQWGIGITDIRLSGSTGTLNGISTSCDSLVRASLLVPISRPVRYIQLQFRIDQGSDWLHLAEVTFYGRGSIFPSNVVLNPSPTPPPVITPLMTTRPGTSIIQYHLKLVRIKYD